MKFKDNHVVTAEEVRRLLAYDPDTGIFVWKVDRGIVRAGDIAGRTQKIGRTEYVYITVSIRQYRAHRLAWLYVHGEWPRHLIDHINGIGSDNRICNLREATNAQNMQAPNVRLMSNNKSGHAGVTFHKDRQEWRATICVQQKRIFIGRFDTMEAAAEARAKAKKIHHAFSGD